MAHFWQELQQHLVLVTPIAGDARDHLCPPLVYGNDKACSEVNGGSFDACMEGLDQATTAGHSQMTLTENEVVPQQNAVMERSRYPQRTAEVSATMNHCLH